MEKSKRFWRRILGAFRLAFSGRWRAAPLRPLVGAAAVLGLAVLAACGSPPATPAPTISGIGDRSTGSNQPVSVEFTVADANLAGLSVSARSSDQAVVADAGLSFTGSGATRTLQITPVTDAAGVTTITVTVTNVAGRSASTSFQLAIEADQRKRNASDAAWFDQFGYSLDVSGDYAIVGAPYDDADEGPDIRTGAAYIFHRVGESWVQQAKLKASDGGAHDEFGEAVAISGDYAIVGTFRYRRGQTPPGAAYVFKRDGTTWTEQVRLSPPTEELGTRFGFSVGISGETAIVGAFEISGENGEHAGAAYVFDLTDEGWTYVAELTASDAATHDYFGYAVSIQDDYAIVGAPHDAYDLYGTTNPGSAYVFHRDEGTWTEQAKLTASDAAEFDKFGMAIAISGSHAVVGVPFDDDGAELAGSAYVFERSGATWTERAKLTAPDPALNDRFGTAVDVSGDTVIVGVPFDDDHAEGAGSAFVYQLIGGAWTQQTKLTAPDAAQGAWFGSSVALADEHYLVGAPRDGGAGMDSGATYFLWRIR